MVAIGLFMITFALVGCSNNNEASEDVSRRASLVSNSNQVSTANLSTTSSTTGITLKDAVENNVKFDKIYFDAHYYGDVVEGYHDLCDEYDLVAVGGSCPFIYNQEYDLGFDALRYIDNIFIPVYSSELGKFLYGVLFTYTMTGQEASDQGLTNYDIRLESIEMCSLYNEDITTYTKLVEYVSTNYVWRGGWLDLHYLSDYENSEDFYMINNSGDTNFEIELEKTISLDLDCTSVISFETENEQYVTLHQNLPDDFSEAVMAGMMVEPADTDNPIINIPTVNVNVDSPISFNEIKSQITATDATEGDITSKIEIVSNEYVLDAEGKIPVGNYEYVVKVTDEALNSSTATGLICVQDTTAPIVTANNATTLYNVTLTDEEIRSLFNYSDNYDSTDALNVVINRDAYTNTLGTYDITCKVTDLSGNTGEATAKVTVYDNIRPTLYTPKNLTLSTVSPINYDDVFAKCGAYDGYDGEIEFTLTDTDKMVETKAVGSYTWTIEASDSTGNKSIETFEIIIVDKDIPVINFNTDYFFFTSKYNLLTKDEIVTMLLKTSQVTGSVESNNIESITSDYFNSPHELGEYDLTVKLTDGTTYDNTVVVTDEPEKEFKFTDLFTKIYWETWANNWKIPDNWNWLHWTIISIGAVAVLAAVVAVLKKK